LLILSRNSRPALNSTDSGLNGESPLAISSALTNSSQSSISGRIVNEAVVLPAPFGPAIIYKSLLKVNYRVMVS